MQSFGFVALILAASEFRVADGLALAAQSDACCQHRAQIFVEQCCSQINGITIQHRSAWPIGQSTPPCEPGQPPPTVLLIMGLGGTLTAWRSVEARLVLKGFHVLSFDNRDTGLSYRFDTLLPDPRAHLAPDQSEAVWAYTLDDMAEDALGVLDHHGVKSAHLVGASMGGQLAQLLAVRHPSRCRSLVAIMTAARVGEAVAQTVKADDGAFLKRLERALGDERPAPGMGLERFLASRSGYWRLLLGCDEGGGEGGIEDGCGEQALQKEEEEGDGHRASTPATAATTATDANEAMMREVDELDWHRGGLDWHHHGGARQRLAMSEWERSCGTAHVAALRHLAVPTLVLHGRDDPMIRVQAGKELAAVIPGALFVEYPGGHFWFNEHVLNAMIEHMQAQDSAHIHG